MKSVYLLAPLALWCGTALAAAPVDVPPPAMSDEEEIEPEVQIIKREDKTIEEYRVNGRLYMIKVTPKNAPPYFLIDTDGDGTMEAQRTEIEPQLMIPHWVLFRW
jgi:hypothetical protein